MYCPRCRTEFREGFTYCEECRVDLVEVLPPLHEPKHPKDVELVVVFRGDPNGATVARAAIGSAGIQSWIKDEGLHEIYPSLGGTEVVVLAHDKKRAMEVLERDLDSEAAPESESDRSGA